MPCEFLNVRAWDCQAKSESLKVYTVCCLPIQRPLTTVCFGKATFWASGKGGLLTWSRVGNGLGRNQHLCSVEITAAGSILVGCFVMAVELRLLFSLQPQNWHTAQWILGGHSYQMLLLWALSWQAHTPLNATAALHLISLGGTLLNSDHIICVYGLGFTPCKILRFCSSKKAMIAVWSLRD